MVLVMSTMFNKNAQILNKQTTTHTQIEDSVECSASILDGVGKGCASIHIFEDSSDFGSFVVIAIASGHHSILSTLKYHGDPWGEFEAPSS